MKIRKCPYWRSKIRKTSRAEIERYRFAPSAVQRKLAELDVKITAALRSMY